MKYFFITRLLPLLPLLNVKLCLTKSMFSFQCELDGVEYDVSYLNTFCYEHGFEGWSVQCNNYFIIS